MLFEQVAKRLIDIEEHEYTLETDDTPYVAACQSRFDTPEIIAVLGDVVRRMKMLKGTRAAIGRKGFDADLNILAEATSQDFMEALNIAGPKESMSSALSRPDMPAKIKTALRTLLLSMSDVPGTEGHKRKLRFNGHANNILWGPPSFFATPNFADTYHPIVKMLHDGPGHNSHLHISSSASQPTTEALTAGYLASTQPHVPALRHMHEIVAADPRAQAKFFLLMSQLHYRFLIGVERLHIGRTILARPHRPVSDDVASSLQPSIAPGTTDVQAPLEAQGRGFTHGHGKGHSVIGATMKWLRQAMSSGLTAAVDALRGALLDTAVTVQYDSARMPGKQLDIDLPIEPFSSKQQNQSRMNGGLEDDGVTQRDYVQVPPPPSATPSGEREASGGSRKRKCARGFGSIPPAPPHGSLPKHLPRVQTRHPLRSAWRRLPACQLGAVRGLPPSPRRLHHGRRRENHWSSPARRYLEFS